MEKMKNKSAVQMFNMCAYFAPDRIPVDMFIRGRDVLPEPLQADIADNLQRGAILRDLTRYSLLTSQRNEETVTNEKRMLYMHSLLQEVVQKNFTENHEWLIKSFDICHQLALWDINTRESIQAFKTDANHIERIADLMEKYLTNNNKKIESIIDIYNNLVEMYLRSFNINTALNYCNKLISIHKKNYADSTDFKIRRDLFVNYLNRAHAFILLQAYDKAIKDLEISIAWGEQLKYESELFNESELATAYMNRGIIFHYKHLHEQALADKNRSVEICERLYREGKLADMNNLALAYMNRSITYKSMQMDTEAFDDNEKSKKVWVIMKENGMKINKNYLANSYTIQNTNKAKYYLEKKEKENEVNKKAQNDFLKNIRHIKKE